MHAFKLDPDRCCGVVKTGLRRYKQCQNKPGHGPEGKHCKRHDPGAVEARRLAKRVKDAEREMAKREARVLSHFAPRMLNALRHVVEEREPHMSAMKALLAEIDKELK